VSETERIAGRYAVFAADEAQGISDIYERLALAVAASPELLGFLAGLPAERRQPNLFLAAVRQVCGVPADAEGLLACVRREPERISAVMLSRTTQTNEPARCAVLLPLLARLPGPLALIEVGASAGLCLIPDRYGYDYGAVAIAPATAGAPVFPCAASGTVPIPARVPEIVWRRGLDLTPIDLSSSADTSWLETLVWPGDEGRARRMHAAIEVARRDPPLVIRGNLLTDLSALMASAPKEATLVVFHTAVLVYVRGQDQRDQFAETVRRGGAVWISNEVPAVFPDLARHGPAARRQGEFLAMIDGRPVAWTNPHGRWIDWFGGDVLWQDGR
jgi:hypothetical protein